MYYAGRGRIPDLANSAVQLVHTPGQDNIVLLWTLSPHSLENWPEVAR